MSTVAAADTGLRFLISGPLEPELTLAADTPFLYLIRRRSTGLVLFAAKSLTRHDLRGGRSESRVTVRRGQVHPPARRPVGLVCVSELSPRRST